MAHFKLSQRQQYQNNLIGRLYWQYRDKSIFQWVTGKNIIDLGCGEGVTLEKMVKLFPETNIVGVDNDPNKIKICQKHNLPIRFANITNLPFRKNRFDCSLLIEVIEHLKEKEVELGLKEAHRVLKLKGRLIILFPNDRNFKIMRLFFLKFKEAFAKYGHLRQWQPKDVSFFKEFGFTIIYQKSLPFIFWPFSLHHLVVLKKVI